VACGVGFFQAEDGDDGIGRRHGQGHGSRRRVGREV
jgi:hypothetical protein